MNKSLVIGLFVVVALVAGFIGHSIGGNSQVVGAGQTITASQALNQQRLINEFQLISNAYAVAPLTSLSIDFGTIATTTTQGTTTVVTGLSAAAGDQILCAPNTLTAGVNFWCGLNTASTSNATIQITAMNASTTGAGTDATATTFNVQVIPKAAISALSGL